MICTFGDTTDVCVARIEPPDPRTDRRDGRFLAADFADESLPVRDAELAQEFYDRDVLGKTVNQARRRSSTLCARPGTDRRGPEITPPRKVLREG